MVALAIGTGVGINTAMAAQILGVDTNIVLDPLLIFGLLGLPEMGIAGAAVATVTGQVVMRKGFRKSPARVVYPHRVAGTFCLGILSILMQSAYVFYILNRNAPKALYNLYLSRKVVRLAVVAQHQIIEKIVQSDSCVIVGRAADYVLRDHRNVVRIFIHTSKEICIARTMEIYGDTREEVEEILQYLDMHAPAQPASLPQ